MKFVCDVSREKFDAFAIRSEWNHYSKTSPFIALSKPAYHSGHLLGVEDDEGNLIASAVMLFKKTVVPFGCFAYCQYGFNLDIENRELISFFAEQLKQYAGEQGAFFLRIDPNITRRQHEKNGELTPDGFDHEYVTELLSKAGYHHLGYNYGYSGNWMSRYTYRLNLEQPWSVICKGIKRYSTLSVRNQERCVEVRKGSKAELNYLVLSEIELSRQRGFRPKTVDWFEKIWDAYEPYVHYYIVTTNYHQAKCNLQSKLAEQKEKIKTLRDQNKIDPVQKQIAALEKEIQAIEDGGYDHDQTVVLGAKLILMQGVNVWNVNMYTTKALPNFRAAFALHCHAIEDLYGQGAKTYDFEGISGSLDPKDEYYGQQDFKKSFGGDFLEFLGEFDAVMNERKYRLWHSTDTLYRRVRRKIYYLMNKGK